MAVVRATAHAARPGDADRHARRATGLALAVVAALGFALNDSGIAIPGMMAAVFVATLAFLVARGLGAPLTDDAGRSDEPSTTAVERRRAGTGRSRPPVTVAAGGDGAMSVVVALVVGFLTVRFFRIACSEILTSPALERRNYRDKTLPTAGGLFIVLAVLTIEAGRCVLGAVGVGSETGLTLARSEMLFAVVAFGFLGLIDDLAAVGEDRGFKGHLRALRSRAGHHRTAEARRRRGGRGGARGHSRLQVGAHAARRRHADRARRQPRQPPRPRAGPHHQVRPHRLRADRAGHRHRTDRPRPRAGDGRRRSACSATTCASG